LKSFLLQSIFFVFATFAITNVTAQQVNFQQGNKGIIYNKEYSYDFKLHTRGFAIGYSRAKIKNYYSTPYYHIEAGELHHHREKRQNFDFPRSAVGGFSFRPFVFGKQNNLYVVRAAYGEKRYLTEKADYKGVAVGISYEIGATLGLVKPYYLELFRMGDGSSLQTYSEKYATQNAKDFLDINKINGSSSFFKGWSELKITPGANAKIALHLDWGAFDQYVKAVDVGIMADVFAKKIPIMITEDNRPFFINAFVNLQLGKRN
jgi:hypothetical protein